MEYAAKADSAEKRKAVENAFAKAEIPRASSGKQP
jgi:hypothetical protein